MSIRTDVVTALAATSIPVYWQKWDSDAPPPAQYFAFTTMTAPDEWYDDAQQTRKIFVYLNLYSKTDYGSLVATIRTGMEAAGFAPGPEQDVSDNDVYQLAMTWSKWEAV